MKNQRNQRHFKRIYFLFSMNRNWFAEKLFKKMWLLFENEKKMKILSVVPKTLRIRLNEDLVGRLWFYSECDSVWVYDASIETVIIAEHVLKHTKGVRNMARENGDKSQRECGKNRWEHFVRRKKNYALFKMNINREAGSLRAPLCSWILHAYSLGICVLASYGTRQTIVSNRAREQKRYEYVADINDLVKNQIM